MTLDAYTSVNTSCIRPIISLSACFLKNVAWYLHKLLACMGILRVFNLMRIALCEIYLSNQMQPISGLQSWCRHSCCCARACWGVPCLTFTDTSRGRVFPLATIRNGSGSSCMDRGILSEFTISARAGGVGPRMLSAAMGSMPWRFFVSSSERGEICQARALDRALKKPSVCLLGRWNTVLVTPRKVTKDSG